MVAAILAMYAPRALYRHWQYFNVNNVWNKHTLALCAMLALVYRLLSVIIHAWNWASMQASNNLDSSLQHGVLTFSLVQSGLV